MAPDTTRLDASKIVLKKPVAFVKREINFDWKNIFVHTGKTVGNFFVKGIDGAMLSAADLANDMGLKQQKEHIAWLLVCQAMMANVSHIVDDSIDLFTPTPDDKQKQQLGEQLALMLEMQEYFIDVEFFYKPQQASFVADFMPNLRKWLQQFDVNEASAQMIGYRFKANFALALHNQWAANSKLFTVLNDTLTTPFSQQSAKQQQWRNYHLWLNEQINQRMFGEAFSLNDLYVKPRAYYVIKNEETKRDEKIEVDLHNELTFWALQFNANDAFRIVSGSPGAGKSSMAKMLAVEWGNILALPVLFIELHHFNLSTSLVSAVEEFITSYSSYLTGNPLAPNPDANGEGRLILIFDGLDELAEQGKQAAEMARDFIMMLLSTINSHNQQKQCQRQVLITGRDISIDAIVTHFREPKQVYHLLGFNKGQQNLWWQQYGIAIGRQYRQIPDELSIQRFAELVAQPLLSYLVALSYVRGEVKFDENTSLSIIYYDLLVQVYNREKKKNVNNAASYLSQKQFIRVLEEIALAVWHGNGRTATVAAIEQQCQTTGLLESLNLFQQSAEHGVTKLLTAFYFRQSRNENQLDKTFEFTHKSFGEYLTAKRLVRLVTIVCDELERKNNNPDAGWTLKEALVQWIKITGQGVIDRYLHVFIKDGIAIAGIEQCRIWQQYLLAMLNYSINHGLPMEQIAGLTYPQMIEQARNADEALLVLLNACALVTEECSKVKAKQNVGFGRWFRRLQLQREGNTNCIGFSCLSYLEINNATLYGQDLYGADLSFSNLVDVKLARTDLVGTNLTSTNFTGSRINFSRRHKSFFSKEQLEQIIIVED